MMSDISLSEYQVKARATAIYPHQGQIHGLAYATLGLVDEVAEVMGVLADTDEENLRWRRREISKEIGDVLWYCAQVATEVSADLVLWSEIDGVETWGDLQTQVRPSFRDPHPAALLLVVRAGAVAGLVKKTLRDDDEILSASRTLAVGLAMGAVLRELSQLATLCGVSLGVAATDNLAKLASRAQRGVLKGSGNDR
jgi:NTP pyrophosphatase (non-canonical NTP hydrolase)